MVGQLKNKRLLLQISSKLKEVRNAKGLTQEEVFNDTAIHLARIETGKVNVSISTLKALCEYFNISLTDFFEKVES